MIKERYCSYEVSNLLQEKGFNQECFAKYAKETCTEKYYDDYRERMLSWTIRPGELIIPSIDRESYEVYGVMIPAPTHQMACDWLQETHNLFLNVGFGNDMEGEFLYMVDIYDLSNSAVHGKYKPIVEADDYLKTNPKTVGEAIEEALKYSLENLV
jgi:hypothetical protein